MTNRAAVPSAQTPHLSGYQARDYDVIDYHMTELGETGLQFRGPVPETLKNSPYFACIGAAQTLGCFCEAPFPQALSQQLGLPALNLGYGGAGPEFFASQSALLPYLNGAEFVVIQVMSARSQSNSYYECGGLEYVTLRGSGEQLGASAAFRRLVTGGPQILTHVPYVGPRVANRLARPRIRGLVREIRAAWVDSMNRLMDQVTVPVVLFWFSKRTPAYTPNYGAASKLLGEFPHLVTQEMLDPLIARAKATGGAYVETISARGSPQPLVSRFTGQPTTVETAKDRPDLAGAAWTHNLYYPSPEMHEDATADLLEPCRALVSRVRT